MLYRFITDATRNWKYTDYLKKLSRCIGLSLVSASYLLAMSIAAQAAPRTTVDYRHPVSFEATGAQHIKESFNSSNKKESFNSSNKAVLREQNNRYNNLLVVLAHDIHPEFGSSSQHFLEQIHQLTQDQIALHRLFQHTTPYLYYIYQQVQQRHLPAELTLLPLVESNFSLKAISSVGASGPWQLMPITAQTTQLKIDWWHDDRLDLVSSTRGALNYLQYLHHHFHNWPLALAAYNSGITRVDRALQANRKRGITADFWHIKLPKETENYVRKYLALGYILHNSQHYFRQLPFIANHARFIPVSMHHQISLKTIAQLSHTPYQELQQLNPALLHFVSSPQRRNITVLIPEQHFAIFMHHYAEDKNQRHLLWQRHYIHSTQSLQQLAEHYNCNPIQLTQTNPKLALTSELQPGEQVLVPANTSAELDVDTTSAIRTASILEQQTLYPSAATTNNLLST